MITHDEYLFLVRSMHQLSDNDDYTRYMAAYYLGEFGDKASMAVPALIEAVKDLESEEVSMKAAEALAKIGPVALPGLISLLNDESWMARQQTVSAFKEFGSVPQSAVPAIIALLKDPVKQVRCAAAVTLGSLGDVATEAIPELISILDEGEDREILDVVMYAIQLLNQKAVAAIPVLAKWVANRSPEDAFFRECAITAIGSMGELAESVIPLLVQTLDDPDPEVVQSVIRALGDIGGVAKSTLPLLRSFARSGNEDIRDEASTAIEKIETDIPASHLE